MGKAKKQSRIASETSKTEAFGIIVTLGEYTKQR
jgi:hypothetical protein